MRTRPGKRTRATRRASVYCVSLFLLLAAPALTQPAPSAAPPAAPPHSAPLQSFLPALPPSVVPPRIAASYPCTFPHSDAYEHPTRPTIVTFTVTAQGRVTNVSIVQSSGSDVVDEGVWNCVLGFIYAPAMRDGAPINVSWAYEYNVTITRSRVPPALPPDAPQGTKWVMMPVEKYRSSVSSVVGCETWHRNAPRGVLVAFDVEPDGSVKNASVAQSSGDAAVDKDAVDCVSQRAYNPASRDGGPVEMRLTAVLFAPNRE